MNFSASEDNNILENFDLAGYLEASRDDPFGFQAGLGTKSLEPDKTLLFEYTCVFSSEATKIQDQMRIVASRRWTPQMRPWKWLQTLISRDRLPTPVSSNQTTW
jgi:hypothetical protein